MDILAGAFAPPFDDSCVVAVALKEFAWTVESDEGASEKLECDSLGPPDIASLGVPISDEGPSPPCSPTTIPMPIPELASK